LIELTKLILNRSASYTASLITLSSTLAASKAAYASLLSPSSSLLSDSITTDSAAAPFAGAASATTAFTAAAYTASITALVYAVTRAFKASFSDTDYGISSLSAAFTSELLNIPLQQM